MGVDGGEVEIVADGGDLAVIDDDSAGAGDVQAFAVFPHEIQAFVEHGAAVGGGGEAQHVEAEGLIGGEVLHEQGADGGGAGGGVDGAVDEDAVRADVAHDGVEVVRRPGGEVGLGDFSRGFGVAHAMPRPVRPPWAAWASKP